MVTGEINNKISLVAMFMVYNTSRKLYHRKLKLQSSNVLKENRKLFQFWMDVKSLLCVFLKGYCPVPNCRGEGECTLR